MLPPADALIYDHPGKYLVSVAPWCIIYLDTSTEGPMKLIKLLAATLLALPLFAHAGVSPSKPIEQCKQHLPWGVPKGPKTDASLVCRDGYALEHDNKAHIPIWVAYLLTPESAVGCEDRAPGFKPDPSVRASATAKDYAKSGYDIGHMANSDDMRLTPQLSIDSNVYSNAAPQLAGLNRAAWKALEIRSRSWAVGRDHPLQIYVGTIYSQKGATTIGASQVVVPTGFFKMLTDTVTLEEIAFIYPHANSKASPTTFKTSFAEVQKQTGYTFPLPAGVKRDGPIWPVNGSSIKLKAATCR
jgi:endonuclease G